MELLVSIHSMFEHEVKKTIKKNAHCMCHSK